MTGEFISAEAFAYVNWAHGIGEDGRPIEVDGARYLDGRTHWISPSSHGAHNWFPMSYNHETGYVYIPTAVQAGPYSYDENVAYGEGEGIGSPLGITASVAIKLYNETVYDTNEGAPKPGEKHGRLIAWDPIQQKEVWSVRQKLHYNGGLLSTASGLLFQGDSEGMFSIRDTETGEILWQFDVRSGVIGSPVTYLVDGEQYVTVPVGWGGGQGQTAKGVVQLHPGTIYTFKLGGKSEPPPKLPGVEKPLTTLRTDAEPSQIGNGYDLFMQYCVGCHANPGGGGGALPDLARSPMLEVLDAVLLEGVLASQGMPNLSDYLTRQDVDDLRSYFLYTAEAIAEGTDRREYFKKLAEMQYLSDQKQSSNDTSDAK